MSSGPVKTGIAEDAWRRSRRASRVWLSAAIAVAAGVALVVVTLGAPASAGGWSRAAEIPGPYVFSIGEAAGINSVSCASAGNCSAGGFYDDNSGNVDPLVATEVNGRWQRAQEVPGTAALNHFGGGYDEIRSVSCGSAGNCSAGGSYISVGGRGNPPAFVVSEVNGTWRRAEEVPGMATLDRGGYSRVDSVSCGSAGNCSAGGSYTDSSGAIQAFVVSEVNGTWRRAEEVPGTATLDRGGHAQVKTVSCASAGNCSAGGSYSGGARNRQSDAFVVSEVNGRWRRAQEVPGTVSLNQGGDAEIDSVSCPLAGTCSAGGSYTDNRGNQRLFVVDEADGAWQQAEEIPGTAAEREDSALRSLSCASAGNCSAGGSYSDSTGSRDAFVVSEVNGRWRRAQEVPGTVSLNQGGDAEVDSVSCPLAGTCSAGGSYTVGNGDVRLFVVDEVNGTWQQAVKAPGTDTRNSSAEIDSMSCTAAGACSAGVVYSFGAATVISRTPSAAPPVSAGWHDKASASRLPGVRNTPRSGGQGPGPAEPPGSVPAGWRAAQVPSAAVNGGGKADVTSVSCGSAGNCSAGGHYRNASGRELPFVADQVSGTWQQAQDIPGFASLDPGPGGTARIQSLSCASAGTCSAVGSYTGTRGHTQVFVVAETGGAWQQAQEVPGIAALNAGDYAGISSVSCASAGSCSAGGFYTDARGHTHVFVADEVSGIWQQAQEVPGTAALSRSGTACHCGFGNSYIDKSSISISSVSCASAGTCSAGGYYLDKNSVEQAFVADEVDGRWQQAQEVPGTAALNKDAGDTPADNEYSDVAFGAEVDSVSCASPGDCSAGGLYTGDRGDTEAFVADEVDGRWQQAQEVPGTAALNDDPTIYRYTPAGVPPFAGLTSLSCTAPGDCSAGGYYHARGGGSQAFVADEADGTWQTAQAAMRQTAQEVPRSAGLSRDRLAEIDSVSCASPGNCRAGGSSQSGEGGVFDRNAGFEIDEINGIWQKPQQTGFTITQMSCASASSCSAGGSYSDSYLNTQGFVMSRPG